MLELDCLPDEILVEILSRLPIKSLVLCSLTSKWLLSLISSPSFMVAQMKKNIHNPLLFFRYYTESTQREYFSLQPDDDSFDGQFNLVHMPIRSSHYECCLSIVGLCNGLFCLSDNPLTCLNPDNLILWNPSIRKKLTLPTPKTSFNGNDCSDFPVVFSGALRVGLGFGFDCLTNDFKVVRLVYRKLHPTCTFEIPPFVDIYALSSGTWRAVKSLGPMYQICKPEYSQCYVNGAVHWTGWSDCFWSVIVTFNMQDEVFGEIKMPDSLANTLVSTDLRVAKCKDMLVLIKITPGNTCVWLMREYGVVESWAEIFYTVFPEGFPKPIALSVRNNEEIIVLLAEEIGPECRHLMLLVRNGRFVKVLGIIDGNSCSFCFGTYVASLALFKEGRVIVENEFPTDNALTSGEGNISHDEKVNVVKEDESI